MGRPHVEHPVRPFFHGTASSVDASTRSTGWDLSSCCFSCSKIGPAAYPLPAGLFLLLPHLLRYWEGVTPKASLKARLNTVEEVNPASMAMTVTGFCPSTSWPFTCFKRTRCLYWEKFSPVTLWNNLDTAAGERYIFAAISCSDRSLPRKGQAAGPPCPCLCPAFPARFGKMAEQQLHQKVVFTQSAQFLERLGLGWCWPKSNFPPVAGAGGTNGLEGPGGSWKTRLGTPPAVWHKVKYLKKGRPPSCLPKLQPWQADGNSPQRRPLYSKGSFILDAQGASPKTT